MVTFIAVFTKIELNSTQVSHEGCWWQVVPDAEY